MLVEQRTIAGNGTIRYDGLTFRVYMDPEHTPSLPTLAGQRVYFYEAPWSNSLTRRLLLFWDAHKQQFITHADARIELPASAYDSEGEAEQP